MTENVTLLSRDGAVNAARVLREAVRTAQDGVLRRGCDLATVNHMLADLLTDVAPVLDELEATAVADPTGPVAVVLGHLRGAFGHAAHGRPEPAVTCLVTAAAAGFRLMDSALLDAEGVDAARWR